MRPRSALLLLLIIALLAPAQAQAHGGHIAELQTFTQRIGPYELAVTIEIPPAVPGTLYLSFAPQADYGAATIRARAAPRGFPLDDAAPATVTTIAGPQGVYFSDVPVDRAGDWELLVEMEGAGGRGAARIPFTIVIPELPASTLLLTASLAALVALMLTSVTLAAVTRRRGGLPQWADRLLGYSIFACLVAAIIFGAQQFAASVQGGAQGALAAGDAAGLGRPHVNMALNTEPASPAAGEPLALTLDLSDGSTGLPVDDLTPHHEALVHLVVIDESGAFFDHLHPANTAPGRYETTLTPDRPGRYTVYAEIARQDSGTQVIARDFVVAGEAAPPAPPATGLGERTVGDLQVDISSSLEPIRTGRAATLTMRVSEGGQPVTDLRPWLGMAGHLIARSDDGAVFGHIHAAGAMAASTVVADPVAPPPQYGPEIRFVYTFPQPGRYQLWGQFRRGERIVTVPFVVDVE